MHPLYFVGLTVPRITAFEKTAGDAHYHRCRESIHRSPTHCSAVVELLRGRIGIFSKLNLRHRHESCRRHADGPADDAFLGQTGVEHPPAAKFFLQSESRSMHAAFAAHI